jgi:hypothetical protein
MPSRQIATPPISPRAYAGHVVLADLNKCDKFSAFGANMHVILKREKPGCGLNRLVDSRNIATTPTSPRTHADHVDFGPFWSNSSQLYKSPLCAERGRKIEKRENWQ